MYTGRDFSPQESTESEVFGLDFVNDLEQDEALISAAWSLAVISGVDPTPNGHLDGLPKVVVPTGGFMSTASIQRISGLLPGVTYRVKAVAVTTQGNIKSLWSHIQGIGDDI